MPGEDGDSGAGCSVGDENTSKLQRESPEREPTCTTTPSHTIRRCSRNAPITAPTTQDFRVLITHIFTCAYACVIRLHSLTRRINHHMQRTKASIHNSKFTGKFGGYSRRGSPPPAIERFVRHLQPRDGHDLRGSLELVNASRALWTRATS